MAKANAKKQTKKKAEPVVDLLMNPEALHKLVGAYGPYDPPEAPIPTKGYVTFWDAGSSIATLVKKHPQCFYMPRLYEGERCCKDTDSWRWKQIDFTAQGIGEPHDPKSTPPTARELVMYLVLLFLTKGEKPETLRLRCRDVTESGRRIVVTQFVSGIEIANVSDLWKSPGIATCSLLTPMMPTKRK